MYDTVVYVYPLKKFVSFSHVAKVHIQALREAGFNVVEVDEKELHKDMKFDCPVIIHPLFYNRDRIPKAPIIIGVDVIETTCISREIYATLERVHALIVPSKFSAYNVQRVGFKHVYVVPHFLPPEFDRPKRDVQHPIIRWLIECKFKEKWLAILYQIPHSGLRKGALEAWEIFHALRKRFGNAKFKPVIKRVDILDPLLGALWTLNCFEIAEKLDIHDLIDLYDSVDAHLVVSRAGGFELTALESAYRGTVTIAPVCGCFSEYAHVITIPLGCTYHACHYDDHFMHVGFGWRVDIEDAVMKLTWFIEDPEPFKELALKRAEEARRDFNFEVGAKRFVTVIDRIIKKLSP